MVEFTPQLTSYYLLKSKNKKYFNLFTKLILKNILKKTKYIIYPARKGFKCLFNMYVFFNLLMYQIFLKLSFYSTIITIVPIYILIFKITYYSRYYRP